MLLVSLKEERKEWESTWRNNGHFFFRFDKFCKIYKLKKINNLQAQAYKINHIPKAYHKQTG